MVHTINGINIKNSIVMAPMATFHPGNTHGQVTDQICEFYGRRAKGGVGMIIVEACSVHEGGKLTETQLGIWDDRQISGHRKLADIIKGYHTVALLQIHHSGIRSISGEPAGPSAYKGKINEKHYDAREMLVDEIIEMKKWFVKAASRAQQSGYDGVEIHCAHSYLLCSFLSPLANLRTDQYGVDLEGRMRLIVDIIREIHLICGKSFLVSVRMGWDEPDIFTSIKMAEVFAQEEIDFLNVSSGFGSSGFMDERLLEKTEDDFPENIRIWGAAKIKKAIKCPVIAVGGIRQVQQAKAVLRGGFADFVAIGRALLCDPDWVNKAADGREIVLCRNCKKCMWGIEHHRCPSFKQGKGGI